jgi:ubiquinone/menaquinone biosynthesis C-methylase UbiE
MTVKTKAPRRVNHDEHEQHEHKHDLQEIHEDVPPDFYDTSVKSNLIQRYWHGRRFKEVARLATKVDGRLLDVGCDGGTLTEKVAARARPERVVGVDISAKSLAYTITRRPQFDLAVGDAEELPFAEASFAAIFCSEVIEHLVNPERMLSEVRRCLAPTGYAVVMVPTETPLFKLLWFCWTKFAKGKVWEHSHVQDFGGKSLDRLVKSAGFRVLQDKRFLGGMVRALKIAPASPVPSQIPVPAGRSESYLP